jgi:selenide,water dikinase
MAAASDVRMELYVDQIPFMSGVLDAANMGLVPAGAYTNRDYLGDKVQRAEPFDSTLYDLLFSPETAGGLLISIPAENREKLVQEMQARNCTCFHIGTVLGEGLAPILLKK